jgi:leader peptidase (prepilin peptidase)/N-methyltransferase
MLTTFSGSLIGSLIGIFIMILKGKKWGLRIPFGPYLAIGAVISLFWGQDILRWYLYGG